MNFHNLSLNLEGAPLKDNPSNSNNNMQAYLQSVVTDSEAKGMCRNRGVSHWHSDASFCHGIPPSAMLAYNNEDAFFWSQPAFFCPSDPLHLH